MVIEAAELRAEIDRLSAKLASMKGQPATKEASEKTAGKTLLAEIDDLEEQIAGMYAADEDADETEPADTDVTADDDDDDDDDGDDVEDVEEVDTAVDPEVTSSEEAPGIEDEITQDKFTEVERTRPSAPQTSGPSMRSVAPTNYTARLMQASARLDRVADYLEKNGRNQLAFRIDKIADAIDNHIKQAKEA
jgi:hypothetical protein